MASFKTRLVIAGLSLKFENDNTPLAINPQPLGMY